MEKNSVRKKNTEILEDISLDIKGLLNDTASIKKDIHYIKTILQMKDKVQKDIEESKPKEEEYVGWFWRS